MINNTNGIQPLHLPIIYQDDFLVAIHKPAGLLVHKSNIDAQETVNAMHLLRDQLGQWVYPVHRLDKPTSGILLFALSSDIAQNISEQFENHSIQKTYQAITRGYIEEKGIIDHALKPIADFKKNKQKYDAKAAQPAQTSFKCLSTLELPFAVDKFPSTRYSWVELYPKTGRKHQLRRHLKHISHPIIGDPKYGKSVHNRFFQSHFNCKRLLLAATAIELFHPIEKKPLEITTEIDGVFREITKHFKEEQV
ncbi:MAG: pseudouridine synthase [Cellvibrionaceae bacterium]